MEAHGSRSQAHSQKEQKQLFKKKGFNHGLFCPGHFILFALVANILSFR
jgi:hypothetical protein